MADFVADFYKGYFIPGGGTTGFAAGNFDLTDGNANPPDDSFEVGEQITGANTPSVFHGTVTLEGIQFVVLIEGDFGRLYTDTPDGTNLNDLSDALPATWNEVINDPSFSQASFPVCFAAGTLIATPDGAQAVEDLKAGDLVLAADGSQVTVRWMGLQTVHKVFTPAERFSPVRIAAGALAEGVPHSDLTVAADHAMILYGLAVNASALVNGTTITRVPMDELADRETYYHIETENHDVILANGAAAETFVDIVSRGAFDNYAEYVDLFGEATGRVEELDMPRCLSRRQVSGAIRERIEARAAMLAQSSGKVA